MSVNSRHGSIETIKDNYCQSRKLAVENSQLSTLNTVSTVFEGEEEEENDDDDQSFHSYESTIPGDDIDFELVYALHTFVATLDGQASVVKEDALKLLDDTNSYWWLIKSLNTSEVGYIPAENIESPYERLARLNKHRNKKLTLPTENTENCVDFLTRNKRVKISEKLECQMEVIYVDQDEIEETIYEKWVEEMSTESLIEKIEQETVIEDNLLKLVNPEFNKSINLHDLSEKITESINTGQHESFDLKKKVQPQKSPVSSMKRLFSIGSKKEKLGEEEDNQYNVLRVFAGNINVGAMFATIAVTAEMSADELLKIALEKFHIPLLSDNHNKANNIEYYLTVKSTNSDEWTMLPEDKPLGILQSLSDYLTTPMPSLTYIKRHSIEVTRAGVSKARKRAKAQFGQDSAIRFFLHKRIRRVVDQYTYIKISYYGEEIKKKSTLLRKEVQQKKSKNERIDKLVAISNMTTISELTITSLDKFHLNTIDHCDYYMTLVVNGGKEKRLPSNMLLVDILKDPRLIPKWDTEKLFVLHRYEEVPKFSQSESTSSNKGRSVVKKLLKQQDNIVQPSTINTKKIIQRLDDAIQTIEKENMLKRTPVKRNELGNGISSMEDLELEIYRIATTTL